MRTLAASALSGAVIATTLLIPSTAIAADTCHGQTATVTPDTEGNLVGTAGPDVIVARDGQPVDAGGGDDLICVIASTRTGPVDAGAGSDTVDASRSLGRTEVSLGEGEDAFTGGRGSDRIWGAAPGGLADTEPDVITTGRGNDKVYSGSLGAPNADQIRTGNGDDRVDIVTLDHAMLLDVGAGQNTAVVTLTAAETTAWLVDVAKRKLNFDEATSRWQGNLPRWFFRLADGQARSSLVFLGTGDREKAFVSGDGLVPHFRMGGGNDWAGNLSTPGGTYRLGPGTDKLTLGRYDVHSGFTLDGLRVDLGARSATFDGAIESPVSGVERLVAAADRARVDGSPRIERVTASGCVVEVHGRAGADVLKRGDDDVTSCAAVTTKLYGDLGDDHLYGSQVTDDLLVGGPGFDRAFGGSGTDTCVAELTTKCELP